MPTYCTWTPRLTPTWRKSPPATSLLSRATRSRLLPCRSAQQPVFSLIAVALNKSCHVNCTCASNLACMLLPLLSSDIRHTAFWFPLIYGTYVTIPVRVLVSREDCHGSTMSHMGACLGLLVRHGLRRQLFGLQGTILPGVTRKSVIQLARQLGYEMEEAPVGITEAMAADEIFTTGTAVVVSAVGSLTYKARPLLSCLSQY